MALMKCAKFKTLKKFIKNKAFILLSFLGGFCPRVLGLPYFSFSFSARVK